MGACSPSASSRSFPALRRKSWRSSTLCISTRCHKPSARRRLARWSAGPKALIKSLDLHPGADLLATGDRAGRLSIWHYGAEGAGKALYSKVLSAGDSVSGVNFSPDGKRLIVGLMAAPSRVFIFGVATR